LIAPLLGVIGTRGQLGHWLGLSAEPCELSAQLTENWAKGRAATRDEPARQAAVKECSRAIQGLIVAYGADFTLFGLLCGVVVWIWAVVGGQSHIPSATGTAGAAVAGSAEPGTPAAQPRD